MHTHRVSRNVGVAILFMACAGARQGGAQELPQQLHESIEQAKSLTGILDAWNGRRLKLDKPQFTDLFQGNGGSASGTYNAGTDGGATGTGRADSVLQSRFLVSPPRSWFGLRLGGGARGGLVRFEGRPRDEAIAANSFWTGWIAPTLFLNGSFRPSRRVAFELGVEGGWSFSSTVGRVAGSTPVELTGFFIGASLGVAIRMGG